MRIGRYALTDRVSDGVGDRRLRAHGTEHADALDAAGRASSEAVLEGRAAMQTHAVVPPEGIPRISESHRIRPSSIGERDVARVFISYERSAERVARMVDDVLRRGGQETWTDAQIPPHRDYGEVIEEQLRSADVVLVLWSAEAAHSQWVRAEAEYAREHGKLVQAQLDQAPLPMPFNRIQCARLVDWRGDVGNPEWSKVTASIAQLSSKPTHLPTDGAAPTPIAPAQRPTPRRTATWLVLGVACGVIVAATAWFVRMPRRAAPDDATRIAVLPFDALSDSQRTQFFTEGLTDQIATTLNSNHIDVVSRADAANLRGADRAAHAAEIGAGLLLDGTVEQNGDSFVVRMHLEDPTRHALVWSKELQGRADQDAQLQARIATTLVSVLACSNRALRPVDGLSEPALLGRYLHACDIFANQGVGTPENTLDMLKALREVTSRAPEFAPAHSDLAKFDAYLATMWPPEQAAQMRREAAREADRALELDPKSPDAYLAKEMLLGRSQWSERERLLREGIAVDPSWPHTRGFLANMLFDVGRGKEAILEAQKAAAADLQIDWGPQSAFIQGALGQPSQCIPTLASAFELKHDLVSWWELLGCRVWAQDWLGARAMLADPTAATAISLGASTSFGDALNALLVAEATGNVNDVAQARKRLIAVATASSFARSIAIQDLTMLGFVDDAFALAQDYTPDAVSGPDFFFYNIVAPLRRDPRFMRIAARIGLVDYWQSSGHWPDFCSEPDLPYDCRAAANKALAALHAKATG